MSSLILPVSIMKKSLECIVCGESIEGDYYLGEKEGMDVVLCEEHKNFCDGCEIQSCTDLGVCEKLQMTS